MSLLTWSELHKKEITEPEFLINPYIVKEGITLLWAATSVGKSPLSWNMAASIGTGSHFFGLPAKAGKVLYIELDSPEAVLAARIRKLNVSPNVWFLILKPLNIPNGVRDSELELLEEAQKEIKPDCVFINTLRKVHTLDDKDSATPITVYGWFQHLFPQAALVFIHHTKKSPTDPRQWEVDKESFSGSMHFLDDAQVGIQLQRYEEHRGKANLVLKHHKSQVSPLLKGLPLKLGEDGSTLSSPLFDEWYKIYDKIVTDGLPHVVNDFDEALSKELDLSVSTVRRRRVAIQNKEFPGSRGFLEKD